MRKLIVLGASFALLLSCGKSRSYGFIAETADISDRNLSVEAKQIVADMKSTSDGTIRITEREGAQSKSFEVTAYFLPDTNFKLSPFGALNIGSNYTVAPDSNNAYSKRWSIIDSNGNADPFGNTTSISLYNDANSKSIFTSYLHFPQHTSVHLSATAQTEEKRAVSWNSDSLSNAYVYLTIRYIPDLLSNHKLDKKPITKRKLIPNNGSYVLTSKDLRKIPKGATVVLKITQLNYAFKKIAYLGGEKTVKVSVESVATVVDVI